jgi:putative phosphonate metabolism protein
MAGPARVAVYYAPRLDDPLWKRAASWLGRDPEANAPRPQPDIPGITEVTAEARLYGFHATLKPPMRLRDGVDWHALVDAAEQIAATVAPFALPSLSVRDVHGFLALRETAPSPALQALSDAFVAGLDGFRAPPDEAELARRRRNGLSPEADAMLLRWGYPYVFGTWYFHMTLTRRLSAAEHAVFRPAAEAWFAASVAEPRMVRDVCLFTQAAPGAPFSVALRIPLRGDA